MLSKGLVPFVGSQQSKGVPLEKFKVSEPLEHYLGNFGRICSFAPFWKPSISYVIFLVNSL